MVQDSPIIVYTMGKVGSSTIFRNLKSQLKQPVFEVHHLARQRAEVIISRTQNLGKSEESLKKLKKIRRVISEKTRAGEPVKIITATRDPIARNISAYFQNAGSKLCSDLGWLEADFISKYSHSVPLEWFDVELKTVTGLDVFEKEFPINQGWQVLKHDGVQVLLLRQENLAKAIKYGVIQDFVGSSDINLGESFNRSNAKKYSKRYAEFKEEVRLPKDLLDSLLGSKYTEHFYSKAEIAIFKRKWLR